MAKEVGYQSPISDSLSNGQTVSSFLFGEDL